jgi:electron transport complex protein RnfD
MSDKPDKPLLTTISPHIRTVDDIPRIMWTVVVALIPALLAGCYFFQFDAIRIILVSVVGAVATEALIQKLTGKPLTVSDGSAVVTGLLVAFVTPSAVPWFVPLVSAVFAIAIVKMAFGGLGCSIWNPALAGRAFIVACFAGLTIAGWGTNWVAVEDIPHSRMGGLCACGKHESDAKPDATSRLASCVGYTRADAVTGASPLSARKDYLKALASKAGRIPAATSPPVSVAAQLGTSPGETYRKVQNANNTPWLTLFLGARVGCVGETSSLAILLGGTILLIRKTIRWYIPVSYLATVAVLAWLLPVKAPYLAGNEIAAGWAWASGDPLFHLLAGGVMLGAVFMATDMVTSPLSMKGKLIFGCGCGVLTVLIRKYGGYPEGVCYSILLMNTATPLIDSFTRPRVYGTGEGKKE